MTRLDAHPALLELTAHRPILIASRFLLSVTDSNPCKMLSKKLAESAPPRWRSEAEQMLPFSSCTLLFLLGLQIGSLSGLALSRSIARPI